jgi:hypothetical protein
MGLHAKIQYSPQLLPLEKLNSDYWDMKLENNSALLNIILVKVLKRGLLCHLHFWNVLRNRQA